MDLYILLGVERGATLDDIKRAYKRLARRFHPDINPGDRAAAQQFRQIAEAYETLSDPDRRRRYDVSGASAESAGPASFGFEGFDFSISVERSVGADLRRSVCRRPAATAGTGTIGRPGSRRRSARHPDAHVRRRDARRTARDRRHAAGALSRPAAGSGDCRPRKPAVRIARVRAS